MKTLYFDIDGTILRDSTPKPALADGVFEKFVRKAGFEQLVCVSNVITIIQFREQLGHELDPLKIILGVCRGTFQDEAWFRKVTTLASDPEHRARHIDLASDWWYLDDMALWYLEQDGLSEVCEKFSGTRVFAPNENGSGANVLTWLQQIVNGSRL